MSIAHAGFRASWTPEEQIELVHQLHAEGFPGNAAAAQAFRTEMESLINCGYPFSLEVARMACNRAGIDFQPEEPEINEEQESASAAARIQRNVDAFMAEQAEKMTDEQLQRELYNREAFGKPAPAEETISDIDFGKLLRAKGLI